MITLVNRDFVVDASIDIAWAHFGKIEQWPSWARHIKDVNLMPPGDICPTSAGSLKLTNGIKSEFRVTEFQLHQNWKWRGPFLWMRIDYDHRFESIEDSKTKFTWIIEGEGIGASTIGRVFAWQYQRNLDKAIPLLQQEISSL
tara:strand:+ start:558 stop:986 length:429 start_codon:yes stop_codon:yes gene_type:complete